MANDPRDIPFRLESRWTPGNGDASASCELALTNLGTSPVADFTLSLSGPARLDPNSEIAGGWLVRQLSNHTELAPPEGFVLAPGENWTFAVGPPGFLLRHWSDAITAAYLALADGRTLPVATRPVIVTGQNAPFRRGAVRYPVPGPGEAPAPIAVIPWPNSVEIAGHRVAPPGLCPIATDAAGRTAIAAFAELAGALFPAEGMVRPQAEGGLPVTLNTGDLAPEAYALTFGDEVQITAATPAGFLYGLITLGQLWRGARLHPETFAFPAAGEIVDAPAHSWRGSHLDVARQFYSSAEVKRFLHLLAWNKLNRFHWHLSDDEGWRIEIDAFPALTEIGAWRGHGRKIPPLLGSGPAPVGGFYTKAAVREIVGLGERLGITVLPEIDVPGHSFALLAALPELRDPAETGDYASVQGFPNNCLNPAVEATYTVLGKVFDELVELFPAKIIHIGADEVPLGAWSGSPLALAKLRERTGDAAAAAHAKRNGVRTNAHGADDIEGSGTAVLQALFLKRVQAMLAERGVLTGGWEEVAHGDVVDRDKVYLVGWRSVEINAALAGRGYDVVVSPGQAYYLDMAQAPDFAEPGAGWAGWSGVEQTYAFDPLAGWTTDQQRHFLGVQACIWSEPMTDRAVFDRLVFPRLSAIAETGWTQARHKSWPRFSAACGLMPLLYGYWDETAARD
jgi:hexosaminidase